MKIGAYSVDWGYHPDDKLLVMGSGCYIRLAVPLNALKAQGWDTVVGPLFDQKSDGRLVVCDADGTWHDDCDVVILQRWMFEDGDKTVLQARATGQIIVNDVDDYFWAFPLTHQAHKSSIANEQFNREHYRRIIASSSAVITSTEMLQKSLGRLGPPTYLCRNNIRLEDWPESTQHDGCTIGWVGATAFRANDLAVLRGVLGPFLEEHGLAFFHGGHTEGSATAWDQIGLDPDKVRILHAPVVNVSQLWELWAQLDVAVIPLEDCSFNRAKSALKGMEACAMGLPYIASRLPEYEHLGGRLAKTSTQWRRHLEELLDPEVRKLEGKANRERVEELSIERQWPHWAETFQTIGGA